MAYGAVSMEIDAVLLDNGGVLTLPSAEVLQEFLVDVVPQIDPGRVPMAHDAAMRAYDTGGDTLEDAYAGFRETFVTELGAPDVPRAAQVFDRAVASDGHRIWRTVRSGAPAGLRTLASTGVAIAVVSNAFGTVQRDLLELELCHEGPGPAVTVGAIVDSAVVGHEKPDPAIFHLALERLGGIDPRRAVHIGDSVVADVHGARGAGLHALHYDPSRLCDDATHEHLHALTDLPALLSR